MEIFTFSPTESRFAITIPINDDDILERTKQFFARAQLVSSDAPRVIIVPDESVITILDEVSLMNYNCLQNATSS